MKELASNRVKFLFKWADTNFTKFPLYAQRAVQTARKIAMGTKIRIPLDLKRTICHGCKQYLKIGVNSRIRIRHRKGYGSWIVKTCLDCGHITRYIVKGKNYKSDISQTH